MLDTFNDWKSFLERHPGAHLLQMAEWGELKRDFGWTPVRIIINAQTGAQLLFRKLPFGFSIGYLPRLMDARRVLHHEKEFWRQVDAACRAHHAIFLKIEPDSWQEELSDTPPPEVRLSSHNIQPPRTIILPIDGNESDILARMKPKCRYNIRLAEKKGITVRPWGDLTAFHDMMRVTGGRDNFGVHALQYYRKAYELFHPRGDCELLVAEYQGTPLASLMVFANGNRAWYVYGASNDLERNRMPAYLLQWSAICWAKSRGCIEYDLWGVPDEEENTLEAAFESRHDGLWGVYRFKRGFGGQVKRAAQALDRVYHPLLYWAYLRLLGKTK